MSDKEKLHIILDTTNIFTSNVSGDFFNSTTASFLDFCNKELPFAKIYIPEVSFYERVIQVYKKIDDKVSSINQNISGISVLFEDFNHEKINSLDKDKISNLFLESTKKRKIKIIDLPDNSQREIFERWKEGLKPFEGGRSEKGFKDTLILSSIIKFLEENRGKVIFITNNRGDFDKTVEKEVSKRGNFNFKIIDNYEGAKEYFDSEYSLGLNIYEKKLLLQKNVKLKLGDFIEKLNSSTDLFSKNMFGFSKKEYVFFRYVKTRGIDILFSIKHIEKFQVDMDFEAHFFANDNYMHSEYNFEHTYPFNTNISQRKTIQSEAITVTFNVRLNTMNDQLDIDIVQPNPTSFMFMERY